MDVLLGDRTIQFRFYQRIIIHRRRKKHEKTSFFPINSLMIFIGVSSNGHDWIYQITNNNEIDVEPYFYDGSMTAWVGYQGDLNEIYYWDGTSTKQITNNISNEI